MSIPSNCGSHLTMYRVGLSTPTIGAGGSHEKLREVVVRIISIKFWGGAGPIENEINSKILYSVQWLTIANPVLLGVLLPFNYNNPMNIITYHDRFYQFSNSIT